MNHLNKKLAEGENEQAAAPSCHTARISGDVHYVEFRPDAHTRTGFPAQLCHYTLEPNAGDEAAPERLTLAFHSADVVMVGARLAKLVELATADKLASVNTLDARFAEALGQSPWVAKITIKFCGKA